MDTRRGLNDEDELNMNTQRDAPQRQNRDLAIRNDLLHQLRHCMVDPNTPVRNKINVCGARSSATGGVIARSPLIEVSYSPK